MNKLAMYRNLHQFYTGEIALFSKEPALAELFAELETAIQQIIRTSVSKSRPVEEATARKREAKAKLFEQGHLVYSLLYAAGMALEKGELIAVLKKNKFSAQGVADEELIRRAAVIVEEAAQLEEKTKYMLSDEAVQVLDEAKNEFILLVGEPRKTIISRKMLGQTLNLLFKRTDRMLRERMDKLMVYVSKEHPELFEKYKSSRMIVDIAARRKSSSDDSPDSENSPPSDDG